MEYNFRTIENKWQQYWRENKTYKTGVDSNKPKYYVLDMFPYPSGAGLHVGHPLGYIASDIFARYKRAKGFNVLHPMGYDSFGLPAEQYAIQTGQHPAITTEQNIARYREQLDKIGFSFDWDAEVRTSNPDYYKWTQWIFIQIFHSWYNTKTDKAEKIETLIAEFERNGNQSLSKEGPTAIGSGEAFTAADWKQFSEKEKQEILMNYRLAFLSETMVNWCPQLGSVLANDEVKDGVSERGGYPVERKLMQQWSMRITAYAQRLLDGLNDLDWSDSLKESQRNWIGKSEGTSLQFRLTPGPSPTERGGQPHLAALVSENLNETVFEKVIIEHYKTANPINWEERKKYARENRKNPTAAESILWEKLRNNYLGFKIRRQHPIDVFIVDFVCIDSMLVIEVDGEIHDQQIAYDLERTKIIESFGFKVIHFTNDNVERNTDKVIAEIKATLESRPKNAPHYWAGNANEMQSQSENNFTSESRSPLQGRGAGGEAIQTIEVFTTRPDTIFGVTFVTLAPEHELVSEITTPENKTAVEEYVIWASNRSERERQADVKKITGVFTGAYVEHPFTKKLLPVWVGDYVLAGYGTGAVMAVPAHDTRDFAFAKNFNLPIITVINSGANPSPLGEGAGGEALTEAYDLKEGTCINSDFLNGLEVKVAIKRSIEEIEKHNIGKGKINFRLRDAIFGRQRYWGEPIPIYYKEGIPYTLPESALPLILPEVDKYLPTSSGEPPLARAVDFSYNGFPIETTTMPGWAGSSWYFLRYMDAHNTQEFASKKATDYWQNIDLYLGGSEHATGHLLYVRFWTKFLFDLGYISFDEPAKKLINQGMIQGTSSFVYRINGTKKLVSHGLKHNYETTALHVDVNIVKNNELDIEAFKKWREDFADAEFILENGKYICGTEVEKMSKSKYNVVSPDDIVENFGADCLRMYEMFLGPLEQSKPWNTNGITGVSGFLKKLWRLYDNALSLSFGEAISPLPERGAGGEANKAELKTLHKTIKKITEDIERFSFNTSVSSFMICVNELTDLKCVQRSVLEPLAILLAPYAPHIAEELWQLLGHSISITNATWPAFDEAYLIEDSFEYPVSINGKVKFKCSLSLALQSADIEKEVLASDKMKELLNGASPKKIIIVHGKIINVVL